MEELLKEQHERCKRLHESSPTNISLENALSFSTVALGEFRKSSRSLMKVFENYSKSILDLTYFYENKLTEKAFPADTALAKLNEILRLMALCSELVEKHFNRKPSEKELIQLLTLEVVECIHWRVGALLYMYCHTVRGKPERVEKERNILLRGCCVGVCHLHKMAAIRTPLSNSEDVISHDATTTELLRKGIFSDVHMLSLMYAGEMCYWYWKETNKITDSSAKLTNDISISSEPDATEPEVSYLAAVVTCLCGEAYFVNWGKLFNAFQFGQDCLAKYTEVARGPLKEHGWKYDNAVKMIVEMKKLSVK